MAWTPKEKRSWTRLIDHLNSELPSDKHIGVRRVYVAGGCADIRDDGDQYLIRIRPSATYQEAVDALQHEWAHALAGFYGGERHDLSDHGGHWGEALSTVHQACLKLWNDKD